MKSSVAPNTVCVGRSREEVAAERAEQTSLNSFRMSCAEPQVPDSFP